MPRIIPLALLLSLLMLGGAPAHAQEPPEDAQEDTSEAEAVPQPEAPKQISTVIIDNNRLSVEFVDVSFGEILRSISQKAGFRLEGSSPAFNKKITTKFNDLDMDTGLLRLFSMVKESNYFISYNAKGAITELKMPSPRAFGMTSQPSYGVGASGGVTERPRIFHPRRRRSIFPQPAVYPPPRPEETEATPDE